MRKGPHILISYRRSDSAPYAGRLFDLLDERFPGSVFLDVESIAAGEDFIRRLEECVRDCDVLIAVIGKSWLSAQHEDGRRRLEDPQDYLRIEIATELRLGILVIPTLVDGARLPEAHDLPDDLAPLIRLQAAELRDSSFRKDAQSLRRRIEQATGRLARRKFPTVARMAFTVCSLLLVLALCSHYWLQTRPSGVVMGAIVDESHRGVEGVLVDATQYGRSVRTGKDGRFAVALGNNARNVVSITASKPCYKTLTTEIAVGDADSSIVLDPAPCHP